MDYLWVVYKNLDDYVCGLTSEVGGGLALRIENNAIRFFYSAANTDDKKSWILNQLRKALAEYEIERTQYPGYEGRFVGVILCHSDMEGFLIKSIERKIIPENTQVVDLGDEEEEVDVGQISKNLAREAIMWQNRRRQ